MKAKYTANWGVQIVGMIFQTRSKVLVLFLRIYGSENKFNFNRWTKYIFLERVIYIVEKTEGIMSKKKSRVIKVNVIYGDKNLKDCMEQVIQRHNG